MGLLNGQVIDESDFFGVGARVIQTATTSITNSFNTTLPFASESFDTDGFHDNATNNTRLTVPTGLDGYYLVVGNMRIPAQKDTGLIIRLNGATDIAISHGGSVASGLGGTSISAIVLLNAGDYVELIAGVSSTDNTSGNQQTNFAIYKLSLS